MSPDIHIYIHHIFPESSLTRSPPAKAPEVKEGAAERQEGVREAERHCECTRDIAMSLRLGRMDVACCKCGQITSPQCTEPCHPLSRGGGGGG